MADAGLQVFNDSQILQIDSTYSNARLLAKYTVTPSDNTRVYCFLYSVDVQIPGTAPYIAYKCTDDTFVMTYVKNGVRYARVENSNRVPVTIYVFDMSAPGSSGFGFEVFNAQGQIVFSGSERYCKVLGSRKVDANDQFKSYNFQYPGRNVAIIANANARVVNSGPSDNQIFFDSVFFFSYGKTTQDTAIISYGITRVIQFQPQPPAAYPEVKGDYLFVDVSNM